jgi:hypothetical protein
MLQSARVEETLQRTVPASIPPGLLITCWQLKVDDSEKEIDLGKGSQSTATYFMHSMLNAQDMELQQHDAVGGSM